MKRDMIDMATKAGCGLSLLAGILTMASVASAQTPGVSDTAWRIVASTGGYVAPSALIRAADSSDTELAAGPAFALESQYIASDFASVYASALVAFGSIQLGSSIQPAVAGPLQTGLVGGTGGVILTGTGWLGERVQPTLRAGGGLKWYRFDLMDTENQVRPTADLGLGLRGVGAGGIEGIAEVRYLLSSFDQSRLPIRGIVPQDQRQNDLVFSIGIGLRP